MNRKQHKYNRPQKDYWKFPEDGYPQRVFWKIVAGPPNFKLDVLMDSDLVFSRDDHKYILSL